jgi:hypothetical protein
VVGVAVLSPTAVAEPGEPNSAFGADGVARTTIGIPSDVLVRTSGKVVTAGVVDDTLVVEKRLSNGRLDRQFALDGRFVLSDLSVLDSSDQNELGVDPDVLIADQDGSIVVAFSTLRVEYDEGDPVTFAEPYIMRLTRAGRLDTTFGGDGIRPLPGRGTDQARVVDMFVDARGRIVLLQQAWSPSYASRPSGCTDEISCDRTDRVLVSRLRSDGTPIRTFDGSLAAELTTTWPELIEPVGFAPSGAGVVVLYRTYVGFESGEVAVRRVTRAGRLDHVYGRHGVRAITVPSGKLEAFGIAARPGGGVVIGADLVTSGRRLTLTALTADGDLDTTFSRDGFGTFSAGPTASGLKGAVRGAEVAVAANGVIYVAGESARPQVTSPTQGFVTAVQAKGLTSWRFGVYGTRWIDIGGSTWSGVTSLALGHARDPLFIAGSQWNQTPGPRRGFLVSLETR